ncbi:MAG: acyl carrier protein [Armatimonadetes bacterium]|nr:acyl carrier protein [Armatimonadota bacterium]
MGLRGRRAASAAAGAESARSGVKLGGLSLLGVSLFDRVEDAFGIRLPLASLLEAPTPALLTELLAGRAENLVPEKGPGDCLRYRRARSRGILSPVFHSRGPV